MIPLKYNVRNLRVRWVTTLMTVLGTGLIVWSSCILFGLVEGLQHSLNVSGDPLDLIVLRKGSTNETNGGFDRAQGRRDRDARRDRPRRAGRPLAATELLNIPVVERIDGTPDEHHRPRASTPASRKLRPDFKIVPGARLRARARASASSAGACRGGSRGPRSAATLKVGEKESYRVVGLFTAGGSAAESEVWVDFKDLPREHQPRGLRLERPAPRRVGRRPRPDQEDDRRRHPVQARRDPRGRLLRRAVAVEPLPQGGGHADRRPPDDRRDVRRGQHDVRRRQLADPRDRHDAGPRLLAVRHPGLVPRRVGPALHPRRRCSACWRRSRSAP